MAEGYYYRRTNIEGLAHASDRTVEATYKMLQRIRHVLQECIENTARQEEAIWASGWSLPNVAAVGSAVPDATIVGCQGTEGRWPGKQALEFRSVSDRVRFNAPGEFGALTLSAWVNVKGLDRQFNSLFMCDGFDPGKIHWQIRNEGCWTWGCKGRASKMSKSSPARQWLDSISSASGCIWPLWWMARTGRWFIMSTAWR
ncbi:MAG: hypothetical protein ABSC03_08460 [Verrucomicrobiota bacterium]